MKNKGVYKAINWLVPIFIIGLIIFDSTLEALVLGIAYFIYRVIADLSKIYSYIAIKNYAKGNLEKAKKYYAKAYRAKVKEGPVVASYAYLLILLSEYDQAEEVIRDLESMKLTDRTTTSIILCKAVIMWKKSRNLFGALSQVEGVQETMRNQWYYNIYAKLCIFSGNMEKAKQAAIKGYEYLNSNPVAVENLLIIHSINKDKEKALSAADKLIKGKKKMRPFSQDAYYYCAKVYEEDGQLELAKNLYFKAAQYEHTSMTYINKEEVLKKAGEYAR